jgi:hypothetical protein
MPAMMAAFGGQPGPGKPNTNRAWQVFAHAPIIGEWKANINYRPRSASIGPLAAVAFNDPIQTFPELRRKAHKDLKSRSDFSPLDF